MCKEWMRVFSGKAGLHFCAGAIALAFENSGSGKRLAIDLDIPHGPVDKASKDLWPMLSYEHGILGFDAANRRIPGKGLLVLNRCLIAGMGDDLARKIPH